MINRNKNSAVVRAQAEMKQAVNSSCRQLNSSRYTKDKMIRAMEAAGYWYDDIDSYDDGYVVFRGDYGSMTFDNLNEVADWLDGVVFDDPEVADKVDAILNSNRRVNSSRRPLDSARVGRTIEVPIIQGNYGYGWEDVSEYEKGQDALAKADIKEYRASRDGGSYRIIYRRVPNPAYKAPETVVEEEVKVDSSRRPSLKTRKAVEYSINCARRRAGYSR